MWPCLEGERLKLVSSLAHAASVAQQSCHRRHKGSLLGIVVNYATEKNLTGMQMALPM